MGRPSKYTPEFRQEAVRLHLEGGSTIAESARRIGLHPETFRKWVRQAEVDSGQRSGVSSAEHAEIVRLKREVRRLEEEKLILQKAAAFFARETGQLP
jgi:transposase